MKTPPADTTIVPVQPPTPDATWNQPLPEKLPEQTWWPATLGFGITFTGWGLISSSLLLIPGLITVTVALIGWIRDILHERNAA